MTNNIDKIWIIAGVFWIGALVLSYWNISQMTMVIHSRERIAASRMIKQFADQHAAEISNIMTRKEILFQPVQSPKIGAFSAGNELAKLCNICSLYNIKVDNRPIRENDEKAQINILFRGNFHNTLKWIDALQNNYPYMKITNIKMTHITNSDQMETKAMVYYKFKILQPEGEAN